MTTIPSNTPHPAHIQGSFLAGIGDKIHAAEGFMNLHALGAFGRGVGNGLTFGQMDSAIALYETTVGHNGQTYTQNLHAEHVKTASGGDVTRAGVETGTLLLAGGAALLTGPGGGALVLVGATAGTELTDMYVNERGWEDAGSSLAPPTPAISKPPKGHGKG